MPSPPPRLPPIIVLEDRADHALLLWRAIQHAKIRNPVITFAIAEQARSYLRALTPVEFPAVFVLDIHLAGGESGLDFLRWLRTQPIPLGATPAMMLTVSQAPQDRDEAARLGAVFFLDKDLSADVIAAAVNVLGFDVLADGALRRTVRASM